MTNRPRIRFAAALALVLCALAASFDAAAVVSWTKAYTGVASTIDIVSPRDGTNRLFLVQQSGAVRIVENGVVLPTPFIDLSTVILSGGEQGLLGLAFHPQYSTNRRFFVNYTRKSDGATVIARYTANAATPNIADPASATILLTIAQPYSNHNGGSVKFGADGFLYIGMGDGGSGNDPEGRAQDKTTLLGKILRIDVDSGNPYAIPTGNPFPNGVGGLPEIFAIGLRNPWRMHLVRSHHRRFLDRRRGAGRGRGDRPAARRHRRRGEPWVARRRRQSMHGLDRSRHVHGSDTHRAGDHLHARFRAAR